MKNLDEKLFAEIVNKLLIAHGRSFRGIRLRCQKCGEVAFACDTHYAEVFGWTKLVKAKGPEYSGLCIECGNPPKVKKTRKSK